MTERDLYVYRKQYGVNIGSWFCLERWICHDLHVSDGDSELDAVSGLVAKFGVEEAKRRFEHHWNSWIVDEDWKYLAERNVNSVRIPIGFWSLSHASLFKDSPFEAYAGVYENCISILIKKVQEAHKYGIGVLLDLHAVYGGANEAIHSGTSSGKAEFFSNANFQQRSVDTVRYMSDVFAQFPNIVGIQVVSEPNYGQNEVLGRYYTACRAVVDKEIPVYIGDGWDLNAWVEWVHQHEQEGSYVVDHHYYFCFSEDDCKQRPKDIVKRVEAGEGCPDAEECSVAVGEWSCTLSEQSWGRTKLPDKRRKDFGEAQVLLYTEKNGGSYFWTYKFSDGRGGEWDFREMNEAGNVVYPGPKPLPKSLDPPKAFVQKRDSEYEEHVNYWTHQCPGETFCHALFKQGWDDAWTDSLFFLKNNSVLGYPRIWAQMRTRTVCPDNKYAWEYLHAMQRAFQFLKTKGNVL
ncbi:glucan 1,3-beta-glucosidase Exg3 [Schizosaccharomyces japonicus yFS275]|uniref:Glucan 1,3-beta-glucosidase Exg3 n=1 Tax=Schizosaccharomyces japonicus (strain yFS275 / FY16936) TaxID=402676 RepID=B6K4T3_SCHJY|nr:glucan 1,3-beta-glucosidase Exg3 [Schizosaccharomyces japonicus yFS275]EEB08490.1 glucan 1,3-beta-glucosidase Exg3 [Schizosaccharomyces japonicus yFS275]